MAARPHASIGEVLGELQVEFPDITISKIRFLESQGLIDPERTPSGYRRFYDRDVARLRWILAQQQEHFLPLKVIKERLVELDAAGITPGEPEPEPEVETAPKKRTRRAAGATTVKGRARRGKVAVEMPELPLDDGGPDELGASISGVSLSRSDLANASGLDERQIDDLEAYGLLTAFGRVGGESCFDEEALVIAKNAAAFFQRGIEARHLRMYRSFAEREAGLFQQVVLPMLRARNPESRAAAFEEIGELARHGRALRAAYLRAAVADLLDE